MSLERVADRDAESIWSYRATLAVPGGAVTTVVYEHGGWLAAYFRELADAWSGFKGTKSFASLEGQLTIDARHDGVGTVWCLIHLREPSPPAWDFNASLDFDAGAQLDHLAREIHAFVA